MIMVKEVPNGPNDHYGTTHHKYTFNVPIPLMLAAVARSKEVGFEEFAPYLRAILSKEVYGGDLKLLDILGEKEFKRQEYVLKQRREDQGKERYSFVRIKIKKVLDIFNPKQYTMF